MDWRLLGSSEDSDNRRASPCEIEVDSLGVRVAADGDSLRSVEDEALRRAEREVARIMLDEQRRRYRTIERRGLQKTPLNVVPRCHEGRRGP